METTKLSITVGRFVAGNIRRFIRDSSFSHGVDVQIETEMGVLDGVLYITLHGEKNRIDKVLSDIDRLQSKFK